MYILMVILYGIMTMSERISLEQEWALLHINKAVADFLVETLQKEKLLSKNRLKEISDLFLANPWEVNTMLAWKKTFLQKCYDLIDSKRTILRKTLEYFNIDPDRVTKTLDVIHRKFTTKGKFLEIIWSASPELKKYLNTYSDLDREMMHTRLHSKTPTNSEKKIAFDEERMWVYHYLDAWNHDARDVVLQLPWLVAGEEQREKTYDYYDLTNKRVISLRHHHSVRSAEEENTMEKCAEYLYNFLSQADLLNGEKRIHLVWNSVSGQIISYLLKKFPDLNDKVTLILSAPPKPWEEDDLEEDTEMKEEEIWSKESWDFWIFKMFFTAYLSGFDLKMRKPFLTNNPNALPTIIDLFLLYRTKNADQKKISKLEDRMLQYSSKIDMDWLFTYLKDKKPSEWAMKMIRGVFLRMLFADRNLLNEDQANLLIKRWFDILMNDAKKFKRFMEMAKETWRQDMRKVYSDIAWSWVPMLLLRWEKDNVSKREWWNSRRELFPYAKVSVIDACWHVPALENPKETVDAIESFIEKRYAYRTNL